MSAIGALFRFDGHPVALADIAPVLDAMPAWGGDAALWAPDDADAPVGLGARLRATTPEDAFDRQPLRSADGMVTLVADARIDNRDALARTLAIPAGRARALPDTAFVLAAYEAWGEDAPRHLLGDFVFALWDAHRRALLVARDHLGRRVLFWHHSPRDFVVASSIAGVLAHPRVPFRLNEHKVAEFLVLLEDENTTFYDGILRVPPAHTLTVTAAGVTRRRYWALERRSLVLGSDHEYAAAFHDVFGEAVRARLRTSGGVSVMLSGGLDSSSVAAVAATRLARDHRRLTAFHAAPRSGFDGTARPGWVVDESEDVQAIAALHENMDVHILRPDGRTPLDRLDRTFSIVGAPVRNPINMPWVDRIWEAAAGMGAGVLLTGQKGNATISFTGYRALRELATPGTLRKLLREASALARAKQRTVRNVLLEEVLLARLPPRLMALAGRLRGERVRPVWEVSASAIDVEFARAMRVEERARERLMDEWNRRHADSFTYRALMLTAGGDGPDVNHCYRAHFGVEARDPTSDIRVVEFCLGIPGDQYLRNGVDRSLIRRTMRDLLPDTVLHKTRRGAQASDWYEQYQSLQGRFAAAMEEIRRSETARRILDLQRLDRLVEHWPQPLRNEHLADYSLVLTRGVAMGLFLVWLENGGPRAAHA